MFSEFLLAVSSLGNSEQEYPERVSCECVR